MLKNVNVKDVKEMLNEMLMLKKNVIEMLYI